MKKMKETLNKYLLAKWELLFLVIGILGYLGYVFYIYIEAPFESYIDKFYLIDLLYSGNLTFKSLLTPYTENGMLASNLFFLFNLKIFHFSVLAESIVNAILVAIVGAVALLKYAKLSVNQKRNWYYYLAVPTMALFLFTCMQQGGGGMSLQVRFALTSFIVVSYMVDRVLLDRSQDNGYYVITIISIFLSINVFGAAYSFAGIPFIALVIVAISIRNKKINIKNAGILVSYVCSSILYFVEYGFLSASGQVNPYSAGLLDKLKFMLSNMGKVFMTLFYWCGSCLLGRAPLEDGYIGEKGYLLVGAIVLLFIIVSFCLYFKTKMYEKTYLPIFWIGYFFVLFFVVYYGRLDQALEGSWLTNSWYTVHTKMVPVAIIGVFVHFLDSISWTWKKTVASVALSLSGMFLCLSVLFGTVCYIKRLPYEIIWIKEKQAYFFVESMEELPVDENGVTPLFHDPQTSWNAINTLKKYRLSLFRNYDAYEIMQKKREEEKN